MLLKKSVQQLTLIVFFMLMCVYANAQYFKPVWVNDIGGTGDSKASNIAVDNAGDIYVSGYIRGAVTFNLREGGTKTLTSNGDADVYIAKYNIASGSYIWAISFGGAGTDQSNSMTVDSQGNVLITGQYTATANFNPKGNFQLTPNGADDIFVAKYTSDGNFVWAISMGGGDIDRGHYIATDSQNNVFLTASYTGVVDVDPSSAVHNLPDQGSLACFFAKYDANGKFVWAHPLGTVSQSNLTAVAIDKTTNDIVITGDFSGTVDFSYSGQSGASFSNSAIANFVARYTNDGAYKWVKYLPGSGTGIMSSLKIDAQSNIIITGNFGGQFFANGPAGTALTSKGAADVLVASYQPTGALNWAQNYGSATSDASSRYVCLDANNNIYITGYFSGSVVIDPTLSNGTLTAAPGGRSVLIAGFTPAGKAIAAGAISSNCTSNIGYEAAAANGNVYVAGSFCQTANFNTGSCQTDNITAINSTSDSFLADFAIQNPAADQITAFTLPQQTAPAVIDQTKHTIAITVAGGTSLSALAPTITVSNSGTVSPVSGLSQNFTSPVVYNVTSNCPATAYTVTVTLGAKSVTTCSGATNTLTGDTENPLPTAYIWQVQQGGTWVNAPGVINNKDYQTSAITNSTNANITYSLRRQISTSGVISYDSYYDLTVQPIIAIANNTATPPAITAFCANGTPGVITGSTPTGGNGTYIYQWQSSTDDITFTDIPTANLINFTPGTLTITSYYRRKVTSGTCVVPVLSNVVAITVIPAITNNAITAPAITAFCTGGDAAIINGSAPSGGNGVYSYQWQASTDNITFTNITGAVLASYNPPFASTTTYYQRTVTSGVCNVPVISNVVAITVTTPPQVPVIPLVNICGGNTASLSITSPQAGVIYDWYDSASKTNHLFTGQTYVTGVLTASQTYYVEASNGGCFGTALAIAQVVAVSPPTDPQIAQNPVQACDGSVITLSIANPQPGYSYNWYATNAGGAPLFTGADFVPPAITANITYYAEAANATGCVSIDRVSVNVIDNPLPTVATADMAICPGSTATLTATTTDQNATINWYSIATGGDVIFTGSTFTTPALSIQTSYYAEAVDNTTGCVSAARASATVQMLQPLTAPVVTVGETTLSSITFQWNAVDGATSYEVSTDNGQIFTAPSSGVDGLTHTVSGVQAAQSVTIVVIANGATVCQLSAFSAPVTGVAIDPKSTLIYVPNAFTPNGDGNNDIVYVHSENIKSLKFYIYDQWGELLYTSTSQQNGWDGSYKGTREPVGVYVYYLEAVMLDGEQVRKKGTITLLR